MHGQQNVKKSYTLFIKYVLEKLILCITNIKNL